MTRDLIHTCRRQIWLLSDFRKPKICKDKLWRVTTFNAVHRKVRLFQIVGKGDWCRQISSVYEFQSATNWFVDVIVGKHDGVMQFRVSLFELQSVIRRVT